MFQGTRFANVLTNSTAQHICV